MTDADYRLCGEIAKRAEREMGIDRVTTFMDVSIYHNQKGLRLQELLDAPLIDFYHDIVGLNVNMNHDAYTEEDIVADMHLFLPRYAKRQ